MSATLEAISEAISNGLLVRLEGIVTAEVFDSLLEQAEHVLRKTTFWLRACWAAAVLEEHLRAWCTDKSCSPTKAKPTLADYNSELYAAKEYDVAAMKHVDAMIAVGNNAAHNKPGLDNAGVTRLLRDLREFLARYAVP